MINNIKAFFIGLMLLLGLFGNIGSLQAQSAVENGSITVSSPGADLWRAIRQRDSSIVGSTQMKSPDAGVAISVSGQKWREFRMQELIPVSMRAMGIVLILLLVFRILRGKIKIKAGRSGKKMARFSKVQRYSHWSVAILFVLLGLTGLILTFGRDGLIPLIGNEAFGTLAFYAKRVHDYIGPVFAIALVVMLFTFIKGNVAKWVDIKWILSGGGMLGGHASAGRYNAGEKMWFWLAMIVGGAVVGSGLVLDFPFLLEYRQLFSLSAREFLEVSHVVHAIGSVLFVSVSFGHIYIGTAGMEGAFDAMKTGECDTNWAKEHHDLWYDEMKRQGKAD